MHKIITPITIYYLLLQVKELVPRYFAKCSSSSLLQIVIFSILLQPAFLPLVSHKPRYKAIKRLFNALKSSLLKSRAAPQGARQRSKSAPFPFDNGRGALFILFQVSSPQKRLYNAIFAAFQDISSLFCTLFIFRNLLVK